MKELSLEKIIQQAPSIASLVPHPDVSDRYCHVRTIDLIEPLREAGWVPVRATECPVRSKSRQGFQKHMLTFRREQDLNVCVGGFTPGAHRIVSESEGTEVFELNAVNSHDRSAAWKFMAGIFVQICSNGLVVNKGMFMAEVIRHVAIFPKEVVLTAINAARQIDRVLESVHDMKNLVLNEPQRLDFAEYALMQKYGDMSRSPIVPATLLEARREEDRDHCLWKTFNVIQENLMRGGQKDGRQDQFGRLFSPSIGIKALGRQIDLNQALWERAAEYLKN
jgi:hypothetical protein